MKVQLLFFAGCPHADEAREILRDALHSAGERDDFDDVDLSAPGVPEALLGWGSPTILIDGVDVAGIARGAGSSCRVYAGMGSRSSGAPSAAVILTAVQRARRAE